MRTTISILLSSLFLYTMPVQADESLPEQTPWYQIEIILFEHTDSSYIQSEKWSEEPIQSDTSNSIELYDPDNPDNAAIPGNAAIANDTAKDNDITAQTESLTPYVLIKDKEKFKLLGAYNSIRRSSREKDILYLAWMQPTVSRDKAQAVHIHGGTEYPNDTYPTYPLPYENIQPSTSGEAPVQELVPEGIAVPMNEGSDSLLGPPPSATVNQVDGNITLSVSRYLHIWTDIVYSHPVKQVFSSDPNAKEYKLIRFPMKQHRRMRSNEIHYLDHPLFGILVLVTPVELPKPEEIPDQAEISVESGDTATSNAVEADIKKGKINTSTGN
jgi:hypothetical protein